MVSICHIADVHLDTPFTSLADRSALRAREKLRQAFTDAVSTAAQNGVQLVLIAGDLFEREYARGATLSFLLSVFEQYPGVRFFIAPGNHDYYDAASIYNSVNALDNVHVFTSDQIECVHIQEWGVNVYGAAACSENSEERILHGFAVPPGQSGRINVMVLHAMLTTGSGHSLYCPVSKQDIESSGLDYLALGHVHTCSGILRQGGTLYAYPGCLAGRGFDECGEKGFLMGQLGNRSEHTISFHPSGADQYEILDFDITGLSGTDLLVRTISPLLRQDATMYRVRLIGEADAETYIDAPELSSRLSVQIRDCTTVRRDIFTEANEHTLKGLYIKIMAQKLNRPDLTEAETLILQKALKYGLKALGD